MKNNIAPSVKECTVETARVMLMRDMAGGARAVALILSTREGKVEVERGC